MIRSLLPALLCLAAATAAGAQDWSSFNGDLRAQKFSPLTQITPGNVGQLEVAWRLRTGDVSDGVHRPTRMHGPADRVPPPTVWSATPLFVNDTLYVGTPFYRIFALEPDTGAVRWIYDTQAVLEALTQPDLKNRGVAYWAAAAPEPDAPCQKRVYIGTMDAKLHSVDADTGQPCADFGAGGVLDVNAFNTSDARWPLSLLQPPTVFGDTLFLGWAGKDWAETVDSPGSVYALDARTGAVKWTFDTLPPEIRARTGTANIWASMSVDPDRGLLYVPVSSPSPNFFQGAVPLDLPIVTSVTALDTGTGRMVWTRQLVHHDLWDYDTNAAPTLVDIEKDGRTIPALVQTSKQGFLYVLDRTTGEPVYPIEERPVPQTDVPGEVSAATQPHVARPERVVPDRWPGIFPLADVASGGWCSRAAAKLRDEGSFTPPSIGGSLVYPSFIGGTEWGGGAVDPRSQTFVVNSSSVAEIYRLIPRADYDAAAARAGETGGLSPMTGSPYGVELTTFLNPFGMPCWKPPYGMIAAYDLRTGDRLWNVPFGQVQQWGFYMPESWGSVTIGGPVITASGLVFIGASMDARVRALDLATGRVLWKALVGAPAVALPAIYEYRGRQYVVFVAGGNSILSPKVSDEVVAFALPDAGAD
jgi:quinoprotein glucose dehydrogenase